MKGQAEFKSKLRQSSGREITSCASTQASEKVLREYGFHIRP